MNGDCFEVAGRIVTDNLIFPDALKLVNPALVHAMITGAGPLEGVRHVHAWVEYDRPMDWPGGEKHFVRMARDRSNEKDLEAPAAVYRHLARIHMLKQYRPEEARRFILEYHHWGPWELDEEAN